MLDEFTVNRLSQLVYLGLPAALRTKGSPTVGGLADYYTYDAVGAAYLKARFGSIEKEYSAWLDFLSGGVDDLREFRIQNVVDDNAPDGSGFYGCCYRSTEGELVAAFRGSEMLGNRHYKSDYETNLALAYSALTPQQIRADEYLRAFDAFTSRSYILAGHSLGGNLALSAAVRAPKPELMSACYAFNAPGFNREYIAANKEGAGAVKPRLFAMQNRHDLVSSLLMDIAEPVVLESSFCPGDQERPGVAEILYPHSNFAFKREGGGFVRAPESGKDALCHSVRAMTRLVLFLPLPLRRSIAGIVLEALYSLQPPEKQLAFLLERITGAMVASGAEAGEGLALSGGLYYARMLCESKDASALYRELYDGGTGGYASVAQATLLLLWLLRSSRRKDIPEGIAL